MQDERITWEKYFMLQAIAARSTCTRLHVEL